MQIGLEASDLSSLFRLTYVTDQTLFYLLIVCVYSHTVNTTIHSLSFHPARCIA